MKITNKERAVAKDLRKYYKRVRRCKKCNVLYGTDYVKKDNFLCHSCDKEFKEEEKRRKK